MPDNIEPSNQPVDPYYSAGDSQSIEGNARRTAILESLHRFFYNIWPSVNRIITFFVYHFIRIMKGAVKIALEQLHQG